jgi:AMMECR1 domain-containing protein
MIATLMELARMKVSAMLDEKQVQELAKEIQLLEARAAPARVVDERHVLCPACNQVRGCVHLVAELEQLRAAARPRPRPEACPHCGAKPWTTFEGACTACGEPGK